MRQFRILTAFSGTLVILSLLGPLPGDDKVAGPEKAPGQVIIAEGVGATPDEAVKDAFRNAVRQVVGAIVDAETQIENDQVIEDKVLTYSGGFINRYDEVAGSKKVQSGLHRIRIKANIERSGVIAKLKAAKVAIAEIDGRGLFAEAVTQLDAEKDAAAILKKQFEGFPKSCIVATVIGKPELIMKSDDQATVKLTVQLDPDRAAFKAFSEKLIPVLEKMAKRRGEFTIRYKQDPMGIFCAVGDDGRQVDRTDLVVRVIPRLYNDQRSHWGFIEGQITLAIATTRPKAATSIDYKYYILDSALEKVLKPVALQFGQCKLQLLDADGQAVVTDRFHPFEVTEDDSWSLTRAEGSYGQSDTMFTRRSVRNDPDKILYFIGISPVFGNMAIQRPKLTIQRTVTLGLDDLQLVKAAKAEIVFDD